MAENIFDLFNNFNISDLVTKFDYFRDIINSKYNDIKDGLKKYDLDTQEGYENFIKDAAELRKQLVDNDDFFSRYILNLLDDSVESVMNRHNENMKTKNDDVKNEIVNNEVNRVKAENNNNISLDSKCKCCKDIATPLNSVKENNGPSLWPSKELTERQKRNIWRLVDTFVDEMIIPYLDKSTSEEVIESMSSGLFEFGAWILTRDE